MTSQDEHDPTCSFSKHGKAVCVPGCVPCYRGWWIQQHPTTNRESAMIRLVVAKGGHVHAQAPGGGPPVGLRTIRVPNPWAVKPVYWYHLLHHSTDTNALRSTRKKQAVAVNARGECAGKRERMGKSREKVYILKDILQVRMQTPLAQPIRGC